jgi:endogenous inhibitor of DNA gyrase (YacG/DUF329 family)
MTDSIDDPFFPDLFELLETRCVRDGCGKSAASREHWPHCSAECAKADLLARARMAREQSRAAVQWRRELIRQLEETLRGGGQVSQQPGV